MLQENKGYMVEDAIVGVKFTSGEDIMAKIGTIENGVVELILPHSLAAVAEGAAFMPWPSMINDDPIYVDADKIMLVYPLREDFYGQYAQLHSETAEAPSIIMPDEKKLTV